MNEFNIRDNGEAKGNFAEEKYLEDIEFDEKLIAKFNRRENQKAERNRMVVDSAGLKDILRIQHNRYKQKYGSK